MLATRYLRSTPMPQSDDGGRAYEGLPRSTLTAGQLCITTLIAGLTHRDIGVGALGVIVYLAELGRSELKYSGFLSKSGAVRPSWL